MLIHSPSHNVPFAKPCNIFIASYSSQVILMANVHVVFSYHKFHYIIVIGLFKFCQQASYIAIVIVAQLQQNLCNNLQYFFTNTSCTHRWKTLVRPQWRPIVFYRYCKVATNISNVQLRYIDNTIIGKNKVFQGII